MRNLKRALSLALAAAMLVSLMVVGASAADYGDQAQVSQTEAVEVLTGLGVVGGDQNGNFNPTATLTRAEFCVMIANVLTGGKFDANLFDGTSTPFTDVAGHWGANYIAYCYSVGVIAGTSATTFSPDATLTAAQASAILLSALGYNQNGEFGANGQFEINVTRWAQQAGLYDGLSVSATAGISRDATAKLIFNAITYATPVGYSNLAENYYTVGTSAVNGQVYFGDTAYARTLASTNFDMKQGNGNDSLGRPTITWTYNNVKLGEYNHDTPVLTYTTDMKTKTADQNTVTKALQGYTYASGLTGTVNGATGSAITNAAGVYGLTGNGTLVEVYANSNNEVTDVVAIETQFAKVSSVVNNNDTKEVTMGYGAGFSTMVTVDDDSDFWNDVSKLSKGDYVLITPNSANDDILALGTPETTSGTFSKIANGKYTVGGAEYKAAEKANNVASQLAAGNLGNSYTLYLDQYSNVMYVDTVSAAKDYAFVLSAGDKTGTPDNYTYWMHLLFTDGTQKWVEVTSYDNKDTDAKLADAVALGEGNFVSYSVNSDNTYSIGAAVTTEKKVNTGTNVVTITKDKTSLSEASSGALDGIVVTNSTVFLIKTGDTYTVYTGIKNVPTTSSKGESNNTYAYVDGSAKIVVMVKPVENGANDTVYVYNTTVQATRKSDGVVVKTYKAVVDGVITTVEIKDGLISSSVSLTTDNKYATDGYINTLGSSSTTDKNVASAAYTISATDKNTIIKVTNAQGIKVDGGVLTITNNTSSETYKVSGVLADNFTGFVSDVKTAASGTVAGYDFASTYADNSVTDIDAIYLIVDDDGFISQIIMEDNT